MKNEHASQAGYVTVEAAFALSAFVILVGITVAGFITLAQYFSALSLSRDAVRMYSVGYSQEEVAKYVSDNDAEAVVTLSSSPVEGLSSILSNQPLNLYTAQVSIPVTILGEISAHAQLLGDHYKVEL